MSLIHVSFLKGHGKRSNNAVRGVKEVALNLNDLINKHWFLSRLIGSPAMEIDGLQNYNPNKYSNQEDYEDRTSEPTKRYKITHFYSRVYEKDTSERDCKND